MAQAAHVDGNFDNIRDIADYKFQAFINEPPNDQKLCRDKDWDNILLRKFRSPVVNIVHEPFKNINVSVDTNINVLGGICAFKMTFKILHFSEQEALLSFEIFINILPFVSHFNYYGLIQHRNFG